MAAPIPPSAATQQLLQTAGQAAADDAAAAAQVLVDQSNITSLNQQLTQASATLSADLKTASTADASNNAAFIAACQSLAADYAVALPQTIPAPAPSSGS